MSVTGGFIERWIYRKSQSLNVSQERTVFP